MRSSQWITLGIVFFVGFVYCFTLGVSWSSTCTMLSSSMATGSYDATTASTYTACVIKTQSYIIPAFILFLLAIAFWVCAGLEKGRKR